MLFIPFNFPANYVLDHIGVKKGIIIGEIFIMGGSAIKCFINHNSHSVAFVIAG